MNSALYFNMYLFPMILLVIIFFLLQKDEIKTMDSKLFRGLLLITFFMLFTDLMSRMLDGHSFGGARQIIWILNFIYFLLTPFTSILWVNYVYFHINKKTIFSLHPMKPIAFLIPFGIFYGMLAFSGGTNWIFYLDASNVYQRGTLYFIPYIVTGFYMLVALGISLAAIAAPRSIMRRKQSATHCLLTILPLVASVVQVLVKDVWVVLPITAISQLLAYVQMQRQQITQDALTGVSNRGSFDSHLDKIMEQRRKSYYLFMMVLDHFKQINDVYGHVTGDEALIRAASVLSRFFHMPNAFLARYGGDEFCAVVPCESDEEAKELIDRLQEEFLLEN